MSSLFASNGVAIPLGRRIGAGGEGAVFEIDSGSPRMVAKVYHRAIPDQKQNKLRTMVAQCDKSLQAIATWPVDTLHEKPGGAVRGLIMHSVHGDEPVHHLYSPSQRKANHPDMDWAFLVSTARNTAAAFDVIHGHGHVIGDVNPNLVHVAGNSVVKLIDCDSFQISTGHQVFACEVGVPHFTPPELQAEKTFRDVRRITNHDNFGLAVLVFQILLMGRHPYSGVYSGKSDMPLEKSIAEMRYAFGRDATRRGMSAPPQSVTPAIFPDEVARQFERAFTEAGCHERGRPTARDWVASLDRLMSSLRTCGQTKTHKFHGGLAACPWCAHERQHNTYYFLAGLSTTQDGRGFNLGELWSRIRSVASPGPTPEATVDTSRLVPAPPPDSWAAKRRAAVFRRILAVPALLIGIALGPVGVLGGVIVVVALLASSKVEKGPEYVARRQAIREANGKLEAVSRRWREDGGSRDFDKLLSDLDRTRATYLDLENRMTKEMLELKANVRDVQLKSFLDKYYIDAHSISNIGPTRKATLASFGIETAADIDYNRIMRIRGFGHSLTSDLIVWRRQIEARFVFDPARGVDPMAVSTLRQKYAQERRQLEGRMLAGPEQLTQLRVRALAARQKLEPELRAAIVAAQQAQLDLRAL